MSDPNDNDKQVDPKVKQLIDSGTRADLERWFGLPSYEALAERGVHPEPAEEPRYAERRKRQAVALAAVDPALVEVHRRRTERMADALKPPLDVALHFDPGIMQLDTAMIAKRGAIADPRDLVRPADLDDELSACTPQALLRDLHRPEVDFNRQFERVDPLEGYRIDIAANIDEAMAASTRLPAVTSLFDEGSALLRAARAEREQPWVTIQTPRRRVTE
ncbi:MAG TPA: hypothetical protein VHT91_07550 [Kofleriaceae bacterium]|jgi:hypothetical protein|nr:hypothetical protein [Kofleriaceae bacterium]